MPRLIAFCLIVFAVISTQRATCIGAAPDLQALKYRNPGLVVDLGVGLWAWPLPMDFDGDGDFDLVVVCPDKPSNGTYLFENRGQTKNIDGRKRTVFSPGRKISRGKQNVQVSYVDGQPLVMTPAATYPDFLKTGLENPRGLDVESDFHRRVGTHSDRIRANQWKQIDFDADGALDLVVGVGDWSDYGWDDAFDANGEWTHGPLHGFVYLLRNTGSNAAPQYQAPKQLQANGTPIDVYGWPSPNLADFDGDGDLDLMCGEFLDRFTYFENVGTRSVPSFAEGRRPQTDEGELRMDLQMIVPVAFDWDRDGDVDIISGDEDGRVALIEHTGRFDERGVPVFHPPSYFQQEADKLKCGALSTPVCADWDGDGDVDIVSGNTAGYIEWFENLGPSELAGLPRFNRARRLTTEGTDQPIRIQAGSNGSIQGPCEAKWGYTTLSVADWNHDGRLDIVTNSIWGRVQWYENIGQPKRPLLSAAKAIASDKQVSAQQRQPAWFWWKAEPGELVTQWRTTPVVIDWNRDGLNDLVMLDSEGYLALFARRQNDDRMFVSGPKRIFFDEQGKPIRLNTRKAGGSGRRKIAVVDWNGDGRRDILVNGKNADLWMQLEGSTEQHVVLKPVGQLADRMLSSHTTSPTFVDWNQNGKPDLLVGAEDGHFYYKPR